jgi:hypothetical protein
MEGVRRGGESLMVCCISRLQVLLWTFLVVLQFHPKVIAIIIA